MDLTFKSPKVEIHTHDEKALMAKLNVLETLIRAQGAAMTEQANRMNASLDELNDAANAISTALDEALATLQRDDATKEEEEAAIARINGISAFLRNKVGTNAEQPVPPPPPDIVG